MKKFSVTQAILQPPSSIAVKRINRRDAENVARSLSQSDEKVFGIDISKKENGLIDHFAIATQTVVYLIEAGHDNVRHLDDLDVTFKKVLQSTQAVLVAFKMPRIALRLHHHFQYHVRGVDLSSLLSTDTALWPSKVVSRIYHIDQSFVVDRLWHENNQKNLTENLCLRAWISAKVAGSTTCLSLVLTTAKVDTSLLPKNVLLCLGVQLKENDILARAHSRESKNEYESFNVDAKGKGRLVNARYKSRVRVSTQSYVEAISDSGKVYQGKAAVVQGKTTKINFRKGITNNIQSVRIFGQDDPTTSEKALDKLLLRILQSQDNLLDADFVRYLWFQTKKDLRRLRLRSVTPISGSLARCLSHLNSSQAAVVGAMTAQSGSPIVTVHGTGKTTTISAAAELWSKEYFKPVRIIGHSNVCVKNIAEKLLQREVDFKLLVSKEF
ncbi:hypothetical protein BDP27DRAFT_1415971 [Rhodocollybia butyracea]|uniref:Uncharacterized protein n=1 Tax=Rhodocollybia butyracea TaxID=206335 RepID=A0A9P5UDS9_9AGAR|nr:hypothetical protein BDP27DRAFT_1415971 [Rhodocollybia butyracea]